MAGWPRGCAACWKVILARIADTGAVMPRLDKRRAWVNGTAMMNQWIQVALGGATGSLARFGLGRLYGWNGQGWPVHTFTANLLGGLAMGLLLVVLSSRGWLDLSPLLLIGLLGGFTTFSAFSLEIWQMIERGAFLLAAVYAAVSVLASVAAVAMGALLGRFLA